MEEINFDEMRNQIAILKNKLDKQEIINDRMMHEVINNKANSLKNKMTANILCGLFVIIIAPFTFRANGGVSWAFIIALDIYMLYCMAVEFLSKRQISDKTLMNASLLEVAKKMKEFKTRYKRYNLSYIPISLIMVSWLFIETINNNPKTRHIIVPLMILGLIIGLAISLRIYLRIQKDASDIIKQIEE